MRIVIAGSGRVGSALARQFAEGGHDVSVIDEDPRAFDNLGSTFDGTTHTGLAYDIDVLREAGIHDADAFVAVTNSDNANLMAVEVAARLADVPQAIARLDDPAREEAYRALAISYVAGAKLISKVVYEMVVEREFEYHVTFPRGDVEVVQVRLNQEVEGLTVGELEIEGRFRIAAIERDGVPLIPAEGDLLREHDLVVAAARAGVRSRLVRFIGEPEAS